MKPNEDEKIYSLDSKKIDAAYSNKADEEEEKFDEETKAFDSDEAEEAECPV